jgi:esterase/lipase
VGRVRYDRWASNGPAQLCALVQAARPRLPLVQAPLLALYSTQDIVVPIENCALITQAVSSAVIETHTLRTSGHNLMLDVEREAVFEWVGDFVERHSS